MMKLKLDPKFEPCPEDDGDELYANGIFLFNITRLLGFIATHPERFALESINVSDVPDYGGTHLNEDTIRSADLSRPILQAEISPGRFNVIDGNHRIARARRENVETLPGYRVRCPDHVPFLTSRLAYQRYVEYWNSKVEDL